MTLTATIYNFTVELTHMDRGVYATFDLRVAQQPSETLEYMLTRLLAYCVEYTEGIRFSAGISAGSEPAITVHDLTGRLITAIEVGMPNADRLHRASKSAERVAVYTHRNVGMLKQQLAGARIHRAEEISIFTFDRALLDQLVAAIERRTAMAVVVTEGQIYIQIGRESLAGTLTEHRLA